MKYYHFKYLKVLAIVGLLFLTAGKLYSQCCSAGNPLSLSDDMLFMKKKTLSQSLKFRDSYSDTYFSGTEKSNAGYISHANTNFTEYKIAYSLTDKFGISGELGYFINKTEAYNNSSWPQKKGFGLGDARLQVKYSLYKNYFKQYEIAAALGVTLPIGVFDQVVDGVKLPITLQPSSGGFKYHFDLYFLDNIRGTKLKYLFVNRFELPQVIDSKNFYYQYGVMNFSSLYISYLMKKNIAVVLNFRNEFRAKSKRENDLILESTGGDIIFSSLGFSWLAFENFNVYSSIDFPIYKNLNGTQLANKYIITFKISYNIKFKEDEA